MSAPPILPAIMSGGAGTRLWPLSRAARPKQFLALEGGASLFEQTARRFAPGPDAPFLPPLVIAGASHLDLVDAALAAAGASSATVVAEPEPRNTAPVAAIAALIGEATAPGALILLTPADHRVEKPAALRAGVLRGAQAAAEGRIVAIGLAPDEPHTGYGYIERGRALAGGVHEIARFCEKPQIETARAFLAGGKHDWNAGLFLFSPRTMLEELAQHAPDALAAAKAALAAARRDGRRILLDAAAFARAPSISIDYAVMEKTKRAAVVGPLDIGWSDVGAWSALAPEADPRVFTLDSAGAVVRTDGPFVALIGAQDMIVVATGDAVLVAPKHRAQEVKAVVEALKKAGRDELL